MSGWDEVRDFCVCTIFYIYCSGDIEEMRDRETFNVVDREPGAILR